ncbi:MAG: hypothetical protein V4521_09765 [Pseudomonadota bacterium]
MRSRVAALVIIAAIFSTTAQAKKAPPAVWQVMRSADPVTGVTTCAVVASDTAGGLRFTQTGALYPVVEMNSTHGLLVGVSSGGRLRLPVGDILWRIDDHPHRVVKAADNPALAGQASEVPAATVEALTAQTMRMVQAMTATSTMAGGAAAREMLDEMLAGQTLLFRSASTALQIGIPDYSALRAGQVTAKGIRPYPLDASFRAGLVACGITG